MTERKKKGKIMNKIRPVNSRNNAKRKKQVMKNAEILRSVSSGNA